MEMLRIVLFTLLITVGLGSAVGVIVAKQAVRRMKNQSKPLLTGRERAVYATVFAMGVACVLIGVFWLPHVVSNQPPQGGMYDMGFEFENNIRDRFEADGGIGFGFIEEDDFDAEFEEEIYDDFDEIYDDELEEDDDEENELED